MKLSNSRVTRMDLKSALVLALQLAEKGVNGLPIPGVKGCIGGILKIIEQQELREANIETFSGLVDMITEFERVTLVRLSKESSIPDDLKSEMERLAKKLQDIPARYNERIGQPSMKGRIKGLFSAGDNAKALNRLAEDLKNAIQGFQTALLVNMQLADMKREADRLIDKLPVERKAFYNAHRERPIELCEPDTRVSLLEDVTKWAGGPGPNHPGILWLNGRAGVGKSTIAKTLATRFDKAKTLGGSFMFSKPNGVTDGSQVFTTLAYQLAHHLPEFRNHLVAAIRNKQSSIGAEIPQRFEDLLAAPLSRLSELGSPPAITVILLDALDECTLGTLIPMLTLIAENIMRFPFLRFVMTSRPENHIRQVLQRFRERIRAVNLSDISASKDIETYLRKRLSLAHNRLMGNVDQNHPWPADDDLASLVYMANNLFIFAATAVRFIDDEWVADPQDRLKVILGDHHVGQEHPFSGLDMMYREILRNALPEGKVDLHRRFQAVVGTMIYSGRTFSINSLANVLAPDYTSIDIRNSLKFLHSVLIVPEEDEKEGLQVYHKSFADFITDPERCAPVIEAHLDPPTHHARLCLRHLEMARSQLKLRASPVHGFNWPWTNLSHWMHHLRAFIGQAEKDDKTKEIIVSVSNRANAFSESLRDHKRFETLGRGVRQSYVFRSQSAYASSPSEFEDVLRILQTGVEMCNNGARYGTQ